jgi:hypothetical protein
MANAGVPLEIRQNLTGHASDDMGKALEVLDLETLRRAGTPPGRPDERASRKKRSGSPVSFRSCQCAGFLSVLNAGQARTAEG